MTDFLGVFRIWGVFALFLMLFVACAAKPKPPILTADNRVLKSILILPPIVDGSVDFDGAGVVSAAAMAPLSDLGYYFLPPSIVAHTFRQNGIFEGAQILNVPLSRLSEIFGLDSALFLTINNYGDKYFVVAQHTTISLSARLIDLKSGAILWKNHATRTIDSGADLSISGLLSAALSQITSHLSKKKVALANFATYELLQDLPVGALYPPDPEKAAQISQKSENF